MGQRDGKHKVGTSLGSLRAEIRLVWLESVEFSGEEHNAQLESKLRAL